ncbi:hypothetical protein HII36_33515 [Nonomuraea sp. NN258]|uniref:hypothetical protein n=1 Tax=Nonomuraea antri TaxID=2730852 RepID=UPI001569FABF|nr:hypothetical protein [Nonomuraea antri]NRQ36719.1 hypothetical protein [Nonomuraea antri]
MRPRSFLPLLLTAAVLTPAPAHAAPDPDDGRYVGPGEGGGVRIVCVVGWSKEYTWTEKAWMRNDCTRTKKARVRWAWGLDGACHTLKPGRTASSTVPSWPREYDGIIAC